MSVFPGCCPSNPDRNLEADLGKSRQPTRK